MTRCLSSSSGLLHGVYAARGREKDLLLTLTSASKDKVDVYKFVATGRS